MCLVVRQLASLFVASSLDHWLARGLNVTSTTSVVPQVVILDGSASSFKDPYSLVAIPVNAVLAQRRGAAGLDTRPGVGVAEDVVVLQQPLPVLVDVDAALL